MTSRTDRKEIPDPTPVEVPFGFTYESLSETIGRMVRLENAKQARKEDYRESFEESQDFGEDDGEFTSQHEMTEMQEEMPAEWLNEAPPDASQAPQTVPAVRTPPSIQTEPQEGSPSV